MCSILLDPPPLTTPQPPPTTPNHPQPSHNQDGQAEASKYNSEIIKFRTPNIVVVFSNENPERKELSSDRWNVFKIDTEMELQKV